MMIISTLSGYAGSDNDLSPIICPASQTTPRVDRRSSQCPTSPPIMASLADMDPLIAVGFHNLTSSPLCRLPEELLLDIMGRLDLVSIHCLRRSSRLFLRLYSSPIFRSSHGNNKGRLQTYQHWYRSKCQLRDTWPKELQALLDKDMTNYCDDCREKRMHHSWTSKIVALTKDYLHCSGCGIDHPTCLFSKTQRLISPKARVCIGREGFVRVCSHLTVTWQNITLTGKRLANLDTDFATVLLNKCKHESHHPKRHKKDPSLINYQIVYPVVQISGCRNKGTYIDLLWHGHLYLPNTGFDKEGYNKIATPNLISHQFKQFRKGAAEFIAPEFYPGRLLEMNCFDPNRCSCLRYAGIDQLPKGWQLTPHQDPEFLPCMRTFDYYQDFGHLACRRYPSSRLGPLRSFEMNEQDSLQGEQKRFESHHMSINQKTSRIGISIEQCPSDRQCLQIRYRRSITIIPEKCRTTYITWDWCEALDPDSYGLTDDEESFGIIWCQQPHCNNYYKYLRKAPFPLRDINRKCKKTCR